MAIAGKNLNGIWYWSFFESFCLLSFVNCDQYLFLVFYLFLKNQWQKKKKNLKETETNKNWYILVFFFMFKKHAKLGA